MPAMSERIERLFARCRDENRAAFIPYICAGDPNFVRMAEIEREAAAAGIDGLLILDLPPEEDHSSQELDGLKPSSSILKKDENRVEENPVRIRLIAPTTPRERIAVIAASARGFIYYVSREGVTGARDSVAQSLEERLTMIRRYTDLPIAVGFGISNPEQAATVTKVAEAVVIGSAIVDLIGKIGDADNLADGVG